MLEAFLLSRSWRDTRAGIELICWAATPRGPVRLVIRNQEAVCFVPHGTPSEAQRRRALALRDLENHPVDALYFRSQRELQSECERLSKLGQVPLEGDLMPIERFLMERFITGACQASGELQQRAGYLELIDPQLSAATYRPQLRALALDLESDGFDGPILSVALAGAGLEQVLMVGQGAAPPGVTLHANETQLLAALCVQLRDCDPDLILGWNVVEFDFAHLIARSRLLGVPLALGRDGSEPRLTTGRQVRVRLAGRVVLDGIQALLAASYQLESYTLEDVAQRLLGRGKLIEPGVGDRGAAIRKLYLEDRAALARYNLEDCRLTNEIFAHTDLIGYLVERQQLTGLALDRTRGAVAAFDHLYLPRLHRAGYVAPSVGATAFTGASPGGYVMDSLPGLYDNVIVLDFKSLYPSIIRTFCIDPLGLAVASTDAIPGFIGAQFDRTQHILPGLITTLWQARDEAKHKRDAASSQAIKILMNSFYGVLGATGCRFFNPQLVSSITLRGHAIITESRRQIEARGWQVIYGDTDSLFVRLGSDWSAEHCEAHGRALAVELNQFWREQLQREYRLESQLELEFDKHYLRFFMPTLRDSERGSKKRYAGLVRDQHGERVDFTGLEAVRTDWTPLARRFQRELYLRILTGAPHEAYVREQSEALLRGELDAELVYRKRVRRELSAYVKNVPPHVRAARRLSQPTRIVSYCMTINGPEPSAQRTSAFDYRHYLERQLAPAADALLRHCGSDFMSLVDPQLRLF